MAGMSDLVFDIFAIDRASAVFTRVGDSADATAARVKRGNAVMSTAMLGAGAVALGLGVKSIEMAANFDASMTRLTTTAGESQAGMKVVSAGILDMAGKVGYTAQQLATAMYQVESGGFHGAKALDVLKVAAQGARVEGANVTDVAHALGGALNDYAGTTLTAVEATNAMTAAVGHGMMTFQDLAEAMPKIGARAAAARVTFAEMTAALGTMTRDGLPATVAATYLGQTIGQLAAPTARARIEMKGLGIDSTKVAQTITSGSGHGLGDALQMLYDGIQKHLVGGGLVSVDTFKKMSKSTTDYQQVLAKLPPNLQTNIQALATMAGGVKAFQGVLMLGGQHASQYADTLAAVNGQITKGGKDVAGFADVQKNLATQWADLKGAASALGVELGNSLMPIALDVTHAFQDFFGFLRDHKDTVVAVGEVVGILAADIIIAKTALTLFTVAEAAWAAATTVATWVGLAAGITSVGDALAAVSLAWEASPMGVMATVIGGVALAGYGLYKMFGDTGPAKVNQKAIDALAFSYNNLTGAIKASGLAKVRDDLNKMKVDHIGAFGTGPSGNAYAAAAALGIQQRTLDIALAQGGPAAAALNAQLERFAHNGGGLSVVAQELIGVLQTESGVIGANAAAYRQATAEQNIFNGGLKGIKGSADLANAPLLNNAHQVGELARKYGWSTKQIAQVLQTELVPATVDSVQKAEKALGQLPAAVTTLGPQLNVSMSTLGQLADAGFANGLTIALPAVTNAASLVADRAVNKMREVLQVHSPSKKTQQIGEYVVDGLVVGMTRSQHLAEVAAKQIATAMHKSLMQGLEVEKLQLGFDLSAAQASLSKINGQISAATTWADSFKDNVFTQNLGVAATTYRTKNGIQYAMTGSGVDAGSTIAAMIAYEKTQASKNTGLDLDVQKLRKLGLSAGLIAQMQQGGDSAIPEIHALASATAAQIQQMNALFNSSTAHLQDAGAYATTGMSLHALHQEQHNDARQVANIKKALNGLKLQIANDGHALRIT